VSDNDTSHFTGTIQKVGKGTAEKMSLETTVRKIAGVRFRRGLAWCAGKNRQAIRTGPG